MNSWICCRGSRRRSRCLSWPPYSRRVCGPAPTAIRRIFFPSPGAIPDGQDAPRSCTGLGGDHAQVLHPVRSRHRAGHAASRVPTGTAVWRTLCTSRAKVRGGRTRVLPFETMPPTCSRDGEPQVRARLDSLVTSNRSIAGVCRGLTQRSTLKVT
jgi:hypothetical protein